MANQKFKCVINRVDYGDRAEVGLVRKSTITEELDEATLILNNMSRTYFEPFTNVDITLTNGEKLYLEINTSQEEIFDYSTGKYTYTLQLISRTKDLERVILPNLKIRKNNRFGTKAIGIYLNDVVLPYIKKQYPDLKFSNEILGITEKCPEIQWTHPTAKQVINDLLMTVPNNPMLCTIADNEIIAMHLAFEGDEVTPKLSTMISDEYFEQMSDFANNIVMDAVNVIPSDSQFVRTSARTMDAIQTRSDEATIVIPNARFEEIVKVIVEAKVKYNDGGAIIFQDEVVDISNYVKEESNYKTLPSNSLSTDPTRDNCLIYQRGGNTIYGLGKDRKFLWFNEKQLERAIKAAISKRGGNAIEGVETDIRDIVFDITYKSQVDFRVNVYKQEQDREVKDVSFYQQQNQTSIDINALMRKTREDINRLGNELYVVEAVCEDLNHLPKLSDYVERYGAKYYLASYEMSYFTDYALFKGTFSKNYIQRNNYYGVRMRKQFTNIALAGESVVREDKHNIRFTITEEYSANPTNSTLLRYASSMIFTFDPAVANMSVKGILFKTAHSPYCFMFPTIMKTERSLFITARAYDNYSIGMKVNSGASHLQDYVSYVDTDGEMQYYESRLSEVYPPDNIAKTKLLPEVDIADFSRAFFYPSETFTYVKDTSETLQITYQFDFVTDSDNIIIGDAFGYNTAMTRTNASGYRWMYSLTDQVDKRYPIANLNNYSVASNGFEMVNSSHFRINTPSATIKSIILVSPDNEIMFAYNNDIRGRMAFDFYIKVAEK